MIYAAENEYLDITKLEAMTAVCSVGLDMIIVPVTQVPRLSLQLLQTKQLSVW